MCYNGLNKIIKIHLTCLLLYVFILYMFVLYVMTARNLTGALLKSWTALVDWPYHNEETKV